MREAVRARGGAVIVEGEREREREREREEEGCRVSASRGSRW